MHSNASIEHNQNNNLKVVISLGNFIEKDNSFFDIKKKEQIVEFINTKVKSYGEDPDKRWITTWNNYINRLRLFYRWYITRKLILIMNSGKLLNLLE